MISFFVIFPFTFHNVSINSSLRSNDGYSLAGFTFHNVSINSLDDNADDFEYLDLHSIMYLLIRSASVSGNARV